MPRRTWRTYASGDQHGLPFALENWYGLLELVMLRTVLSFVAFLCGVSPAFPCTLSRPPDFEIDHTIDDNEPPPAAVVREVRVDRGQGPLTENGRVVQRNSCDDIGGISIYIDTDNENVGYLLALVDGALPRGLRLPDAPRSLARHRPTLTLSWIDGASDHQDAFRFTLRITPVDRAGNLGEPTQILIEDDGVPDPELAAQRAERLEAFDEMRRSPERGAVGEGGARRRWSDLAVGEHA